MSHENEYYENMVTMLELIWGDGYMAPGGSGNVAKLLDGTQPAGKRILDIGCGIGRLATAFHRNEATIRYDGFDIVKYPLCDFFQ